MTVRMSAVCLTTTPVGTRLHTGILTCVGWSEGTAGDVDTVLPTKLKATGQRLLTARTGRHMSMHTHRCVVTG